MTTENTTHKAEQEVIDLARKVVKCNDGYEVYRRVFKMAEAIERLDAMLSASKSQPQEQNVKSAAPSEAAGNISSLMNSIRTLGSARKSRRLSAD